MDIVERPRPTWLVVDGDPRSRALAIWPRLDRSKLTRTCGDPHKVARLVARRTALPLESILRLLGVCPIDETSVTEVRRVSAERPSFPATTTVHSRPRPTARRKRTFR